MIRNALDVVADDIRLLGSTEMVKLLERLLLAEARLTGIPLADVTIPLQLTIGDGGEDGRIAWQAGLERTDFLPRRFCSFQSKATKVTAASLARECWEPGTASAQRPPALRSVIKSVIENNGAYIVFAHVPLTPQKVDELRSSMLTAIREAGGDTSGIAIDIYDSNKIARWVNQHPSVASWILETVHGHSLGPFQTLSSWGKQADFKVVPWADDDQGRFTLLDVAIAANERGDPGKVTIAFEKLRPRVLQHLVERHKAVRVVGASGLGKTRLTHAVVARGDTLRDRVVAASVLFSDFSVHGDELLRSAQALAESGLDAVLVIDECPDTVHAKLAEMVARTDSRLRLISIDVETRRMSSKTEMIVSVEPAKDELIKLIVSGCAKELSPDDNAFIRQLADGGPRCRSTTRTARTAA